VHGVRIRGGLHSSGVSFSSSMHSRRRRNEPSVWGHSACTLRYRLANANVVNVWMRKIPAGSLDHRCFSV
jgi:hypothetical protein